MIVRKDFFQIPAVERLSTRAKFVLMYGEVMTEHEPVFYISWERLELDTGLKGNELQKAIDELRGYITWDKGLLKKQTVKLVYDERI